MNLSQMRLKTIQNSQQQQRYSNKKHPHKKSIKKSYRNLLSSMANDNNVNNANGVNNDNNANNDVNKMNNDVKSQLSKYSKSRDYYQLFHNHEKKNKNNVSSQYGENKNYSHHYTHNNNTKNLKQSLFQQSHHYNHNNNHNNNNNKSTKNMKQFSQSQHKTKKKSSKYQNMLTNEKKLSSECSTTNKKHSKSVFNYLDDKDDCFMSDKHNMNRGMKKNPLCSHNKSVCSSTYHKPSPTPIHHTSTISITKRKKSIPLPSSSKTLFTSSIKQKISNFQILSNCLKIMIQQQQQQQNQGQFDPILTIKMIKAFNKAEIKKISKPLGKLIEDMMEIVQKSIKKKEKGKPIKGIKGRKVQDQQLSDDSIKVNQFKTPQKDMFQKSNMNKGKILSFSNKTDGFIIQSQNQQQSHEIKQVSQKQSQKQSYSHQNQLNLQQQQQKLPVQTKLLQQSLTNLQIQSQQLKDLIKQYFESSLRKEQKNKKKEQIDYLKEVIQAQKKTINQLQE